MFTSREDRAIPPPIIQPFPLSYISWTPLISTKGSRQTVLHCAH